MVEQYATSEAFDRTRVRQSSATLDQKPVSKDPFIEHYFKRIDPRLAASFSDEQCAAIKEMFGARGVAKHAVEIRRSLPIGRQRYYLVLLLGRERRAFDRLFSEGAISRPFTVLGHVITAALWMIPVLLAAFALRAIF